MSVDSQFSTFMAFLCNHYNWVSKIIMNELLLLSPVDIEKHRPTKILDKNLNKLESFDSGFKFNFEILEYSNFHDAMSIIFSVDSCFLVLGEPTEYAQECINMGMATHRRKKLKNGLVPTIRDRVGTELVLDLDDHILEGFDALHPEPAIRNWLKKQKINCDVTYQITSGQKLNTEEARIRLYFTSSKAFTLIERKAWSQSIGADGSVYTCSQPIYTAPPIIQKGKDPIKSRHGFLKGLTRTYILPPEIKKPDFIEKNASFHRSEHFDFNDANLPEDVISGRIYRRYFMPLAFHYANLLKMDKDAVFAIIAYKAIQVKSREFDEENVRAYIDDAFAKIDSEKDELENELWTSKDAEEEVKVEVPIFPNDVMETWPEPWPMLWKNFKMIPRKTEPALLIATILSLNAYFLRTQYVTEYNRRPNMFFLNLTPSTGNKDVNSKNVIRDLAQIFRKKLGPASRSIFHGILNTESSITADTTFLQSFNEREELFWINTEATRIFQQIKNSTGNSNVAALSDKLIEVVDGHEITGKAKAAGKVKTIENPNAQILFYAQPETIEKYIDEEMVDSGLFGRAILSIVPELEFDAENYEMFIDRDSHMIEVDEDFFEFYRTVDVELGGISNVKHVLKPDEKSRQILNKWAREYVAPLMKDDETLQKVLSRVGNTAEQLYVILLGICRKYDSTMGLEVRDKISIAPLLPLLEYWVDCKVFAIKHYINTELDPLAESVFDVLKRILSGDIKMQSTNDVKCVKEHNMVPISQFYNALKKQGKLIRLLDASGDKRNAMQRVDQILKIFINNGMIIKKFVMISGSSKECFGLRK